MAVSKTSLEDALRRYQFENDIVKVLAGEVDLSVPEFLKEARARGIPSRKGQLKARRKEAAAERKKAKAKKSASSQGGAESYDNSTEKNG